MSGEQFPASQVLGHVALDDFQRKALGIGRFADAGVANEHGVVLGTPRKDLNGPLDFFVTANHGVNLVFFGKGRQVAREALQHPVLFFRVFVSDARVAPDALQRLVDFLLVNAVLLERARRAAIGFFDQPQQ